MDHCQPRGRLLANFQGHWSIQTFPWRTRIPRFGPSLWTPQNGASEMISALALWQLRHKSQNLVSKCSATPARIAATPPGARQGFGGPNYPRHPTGGSGMGCDRALCGGCSCDTLATPSKLRKEPRQGCSYTLERDSGGCSVCAT